MKNLNRIEIRGTVGYVKRYPHYGYVRMNVVTMYAYKNAAGEAVIESVWHQVCADAGKVKEGISKGSKVYVSGRMRNLSYEDEQGVEHILTEIVARKVVSVRRRAGI